jgi:hypothetical protein
MVVPSLVVPTRGWAAPTAPGLQLALPIACDTESGCLIQNHFDHDSGPAFSDYSCGGLGYDGHNGIDFRLRNLSAMYAGFPVYAGAAGRVRAVRDEMPDISVLETGQRRAIKGREAGNSVAIQHGGDWETQYSHLKRGSIRVSPGDEVKAGQLLGFVGLSGKTQFPHVHFTVRFRGDPVDPFVGLNKDFECGDQSGSLWSPAALEQLIYRPTGVIQAGFSQRQPEMKAIEAGGDNQKIIDAGADAIVFWAELFGIQRGDEQVLTIYDPKGRVLAQRRKEHPKDKAQWFSYVGKRRKGATWPIGIYRAEFTLYRPSQGRRRILELSRELIVQ